MEIRPKPDMPPRLLWVIWDGAIRRDVCVRASGVGRNLSLDPSRHPLQVKSLFSLMHEVAKQHVGPLLVLGEAQHMVDAAPTMSAESWALGAPLDSIHNGKMSTPTILLAGDIVALIWIFRHLALQVGLRSGLGAPVTGGERRQDPRLADQGRGLHCPRPVDA